MEELQKQIEEIESQIEKSREEHYRKIIGPLHEKLGELNEKLEQLGLESIEEDIPAITAKLERIAKYIKTVEDESDQKFGFIASEYSFKKINKDSSYYQSSPFDVVISEVDGHDFIDTGHPDPFAKIEVLFVYQSTAVKNFIRKWWEKEMNFIIRDEEHSELKVLKDLKTDL